MIKKNSVGREIVRKGAGGVAEGSREVEGEGLPTCFGSTSGLRRYLEWYNRCLCRTEVNIVLANGSNSLA